MDYSEMPDETRTGPDKGDFGNLRSTYASCPLFAHMNATVKHSMPLRITNSMFDKYYLNVDAHMMTAYINNKLGDERMTRFYRTRGKAAKNIAF